MNPDLKCKTSRFEVWKTTRWLLLLSTTKSAQCATHTLHNSLGVPRRKAERSRLSRRDGISHPPIAAWHCQTANTLHLIAKSMGKRRLKETRTMVSKYCVRPQRGSVSFAVAGKALLVGVEARVASASECRVSAPKDLWYLSKRENSIMHVLRKEADSPLMTSMDGDCK